MSEITIPHLLSGYLAENPLGGEWCQKLEADWCAKFGVSHAVAVNSATSGLLASCMAIGVKPGDEVIVPAWTMSATAAAPAVLGAKIVFADIDVFFTLDPQSVEKAITKKTKAVIVTNLFGQAAQLKQLRTICDRHEIFLIEDNAQAILAKEGSRYTGTIGHMGVFSLNVHKHIQTGEGGVVVTDDGLLSISLRGAMNHGETRSGPPGLNLRMTELTAMMACSELDRVEYAVLEARQHAKTIKEILNGSQNVWYFPERDGCVHSYYCLPVGCRDEFHVRLQEIGLRKYLRPLYELPAFMGTKLPEVEQAWRNVLLIELCHNPELDHIIDALRGLDAGNAGNHQEHPVKEQ
jgi:dTDP-4-amino-4,6-dideoxygalactose transaminase